MARDRALRSIGLAVVVAMATLRLTSGCTSRPGSSGDGAPAHVLVFKQQPMWGDPEAMRALITDFERSHPGVQVRAEILPNASEVAHQYFLTSLGGKSADFDVFVADVVWVPEFARAGWIDDVSDAFSPARLRSELAPGAADAVQVEGKTFAVPWYVDVGLLYWRTDLVARAPRTYDELDAFARQAMAGHPELTGMVWQGRQYEGLVCNAFEVIWGHGGVTRQPRPDRPTERVWIDSPEAARGLGWLRSLVEEGRSPPSVTSAGEEESRRVFGEGRAVFMRNWPYAYAELEKDGSPVKGKVAVTTLPTASGEPGAGVLGGWQLARNAFAPPDKRALALAFIDHLTTSEASVRLALAYARIPPRKDAYDDPRLRAGARFIADLYPAVLRARPRPVTPYYAMMSDVLQGEFSAAVSGVRPPVRAMARAQTQIDRIDP